MKKPEYYEPLKNSIKEGFKPVEGSDGEFTEDGAFNKHLPDAGLTEEDVKKVNGYATTFVAAGLEAVKEVAFDAMKNNADITTVTGTTAMGDFGSASYNLVRSKEVSATFGQKDGPKKTTYGSSKVSVDFVAGHQSGLLKEVQKAAKEEATALFGGK